MTICTDLYKAIKAIASLPYIKQSKQLLHYAKQLLHYAEARLHYAEAREAKHKQPLEEQPRPRRNLEEKKKKSEKATNPPH